jgi:threonine/homoserine/homoserine lactone efflux protein
VKSVAFFICAVLHAWLMVKKQRRQGFHGFRRVTHLCAIFISSSTWESGLNSMALWINVVSGLVLGVASGVQPGPLSAYLISRALADGWRRAMPAVFSPLISDGPIAVLALLVLRSIPPWFVLAIRPLGGIYLLYLAAGAWKTWRQWEESQVTAASPGRFQVWKAALVNLLNPNPYFGWTLVLAPLVLRGWHESPAVGLAVILGFYVGIIASLASIILIFAASGNLGPKVSRSLIAISAVALVAFGGYQLWLGAIALARL